MKQSLSRARADHRILLVAVVGIVIVFGSCSRHSLHSTQTTEVSHASSTAAKESGSARLNINTASAAELEKLPGLGQVLAERVVAYREQYGPFRRAEHLMMVQGFSDHKFRALRNLITVG